MVRTAGGVAPTVRDPGYARHTHAHAITATPDGGVVLAGEFARNVEFGGLTLTGEGVPIFEDAFTLKLTSDGEATATPPRSTGTASSSRPHPRSPSTGRLS